MAKKIVRIATDEEISFYGGKNAKSLNDISARLRSLGYDVGGVLEHVLVHFIESAEVSRKREEVRGIDTIYLSGGMLGDNKAETFQSHKRFDEILASDINLYLSHAMSPYNVITHQARKDIVKDYFERKGCRVIDLGK